MLESILDWANNWEYNISRMWEEVMFDLNLYIASRGKEIPYLERAEYLVDTDDIMVSPEWLYEAFPDEVELLKDDIKNFISKRVEEKLNGPSTI